MKSSSTTDKKVFPVSTSSREFLSQPLDDDKSKTHPVEENPGGYPSARAELAAVIRESTGGYKPTRKDLNQLENNIETRGGSLLEFIHDIRPRLGRLKLKPTIAFFVSQAQQWNTAGAQPEPEPVSAEEQRLWVLRASGRLMKDGKVLERCATCKSSGRVEGRYCECQHGQALAKLESARTDPPTGGPACSPLPVYTAVEAALVDAAQPTNLLNQPNPLELQEDDAQAEPPGVRRILS